MFNYCVCKYVYKCRMWNDVLYIEVNTSWRVQHILCEGTQCTEWTFYGVVWVECSISTLACWAHGQWTRAKKGFSLPIFCSVIKGTLKLVLLNITVIKPIHMPTFVTPCGWNVGAETCRNWHWTWRVFNLLSTEVGKEKKKLVNYVWCYNWKNKQIKIYLQIHTYWYY